jgi:hypothetical protein
MFPHIFGGAKIHTVAGGYAHDFSRALRMQINGGAFRASVQGTEVVVLSPEIAAILGRNTGIEAFNRVQYNPYVDATLMYTMERSNFTGKFVNGISPGNGVYLSSRMTTFSLGYSYAGIRKMSLGLSAGYQQYSSLGQDISGMSSVQGGGGISYKLARNLNLTAQLDARRFQTPGIQGRSGISFAVGLAYTSSTIPLSIW